MPFCATCGAPVEGKFCAKCGSAMPAGGTPPGPGPQPGAAASGMADNVAAALCYSLTVITGILFLVLAPYNQNKAIRFHAFQAIFLGVAWILVSIVLNIVLGVMHMYLLSPLVSLAFIVLWIYMIIAAYQGKKVVLPVIGPIAQQQA